MGNIFDCYSLEKLNTELKNMVKDDKVNNLKLFVASDDSKLSVTLKPLKNYQKDYHGLHPLFDEAYLKKFLNKHNINLSIEFWDIIKEEQQLNRYMNIIIPDKLEFLDKFRNSDQFTIEEVLLGRAILHMASHFGFRFKVDKENLIELEEILLNICKRYCINYDDLMVCKNDEITKSNFWQVNHKKKYIDLLGIWQIDMIRELSNYYKVHIDGLYNLVITKRIESTNSADSDNLLLDILTFQYDVMNLFLLRTSDIYYSGTMPKVIKIEYLSNPISSSKIKSIVFHVVRTTYATVDFMDDSQIINHPFFCGNDKSLYNLMVSLDNYEDKLQARYLYQDNDIDIENYNQRDYERSCIDNLNKYLLKSLNTHTIAVSANIKTRDDYLLMGKRGLNSIDSGEYYCSANGQSEFRDENVSFYATSVYEDLPTMDYNSSLRVDLNKEIQRETLAELGVSIFDRDWRYYGVSYLSIDNFPNEKYDGLTPELSARVKSRRMHFNVLAYNKTPLSFEEVQQSYNYATEKSENSVIKGLRTLIYKNKIDRFKKQLYYLYNWTNNNKSEIILMVLLSFYIFRGEGKVIGPGNIFELILLVIYLCLLFTKWIKNKELREKKEKNIILLTEYRVMGQNSYSMENLFKKFDKDGFIKSDNKFHAIFRVMYILYILDNLN